MVIKREIFICFLFQNSMCHWRLAIFATDKIQPFVDATASREDTAMRLTFNKRYFRWEELRPCFTIWRATFLTRSGTVWGHKRAIQSVTKLLRDYPAKPVSSLSGNIFQLSALNLRISISLLEREQRNCAAKVTTTRKKSTMDMGCQKLETF